MDYNSNNPYESLFKPRIDVKKTIATVLLVLGCILGFISLFLDYPAYLYTLGIGASFIIYYIVYTLISNNSKSSPKVKVNKPKKIKVQVCKNIPEDDSRVLSTCPHCNRTIRLPNKKGKHGVDCPICKKHYEVKIR